MTPPLGRRVALGLLATGLAAPRIARAARFPERPIRMINPWSPGSSSDVQMRSMAELAQRPLGQPVIVENRPGASGTLVAPAVKEARPDGYTIGQMHLSIIRRPYLVRNPQWDVATDFTYIIGLCGWVTGLAVRADAPWKTFHEFMESARASPGGRTYATSGIATTPHIAMEDMARRLGVQLTHVPYRGTSEGVTAVLGGTVDCMADASAWAPHVVAGRMRLLAVFTAQRFERFPEVPTLRELGLDMVVSTAYGLVGPAGMDRGVVRILHDAFKEALFHPENERVRAQFDMPAAYHDSDAYREVTLRQAAYEREMVQRLGLRLD
ncbi:tripartite tricarboxylate transporter substrate binding protein [Crenalkalicoccus roseus]|uniref:tripartite tricarboxylate transporter substrate binding protein n=1 Tax=Crenalkalicoccus roseus TaxID=1485588 RepID=UPI0010805AFB|nr:tripartite tricarboxylate transporter substrate binding protein [Crenalkalicoccus roseus]